MAGKKGRSGGSNRLSPEQHLLRGTFNPTRHGPKPSPLGVAALPRLEPLPESLTKDLGARGRAFVVATWRRYEGWTPANTELLHEAGFLLDQLDALRGQRGERAAQKTLLAVLSSLQLRD